MRGEEAIFEVRKRGYAILRQSNAWAVGNWLMVGFSGAQGGVLKKLSPTTAPKARVNQQPPMAPWAAFFLPPHRGQYARWGWRESISFHYRSLYFGHDILTWTDPMCEWHLEYYLCIWWMTMSHRIGCIKMRSSRFSKGKIRTVCLNNKRQLKGKIIRQWAICFW